MRLQKASCIVIVLFLSMSIGIAQEQPNLALLKTSTEKITAWHNYCNRILGKGDFVNLAKEAKTGIEITPKDSLRAKTMFSLFAGVAFENLKKYDTAETYLLNARDMALKINHQSYIVLAIAQLDNIYGYTNNIAKRKQEIELLKKIGDSTTNQETKLALYNVLGGYYRDINNYDSSITYRLKHINLYKQLIKSKQMNDTINLAFAYTNLGNMFNEIGQYKKALEYLYQGADIIGDRALTNNEETLYLYFMNAYKGLRNEDSLLKYYKAINTKMAGRDTLFNVLTQANSTLADFSSGKDSNKVNKYSILAYQYAQKSPNADSRMIANIAFARLLNVQKQFSKSNKILHDELQEDFEFNKQSLATTYLLLSENYAALQQWDSAYKYQNLYSSTNATILEATANKNIADAEAKFQNKEKQIQINAQKNQISYANKQKWWLLSGLLLLTAVALLLWRNYKQKKKAADILNKKNKQLGELNLELNEANKTKAKLFSIIGHDLRSPISQIYQFLKLQQLNPDALNETQKASLTQKIQTATGSLLETMEDLLLWSKTQMNAFDTKMQETNILNVVNVCKNLLQLNSDANNLHYEINIAENMQITTDPNYLQTIIRNLLQNAIKAAPGNSLIVINAAKNEDATKLSIQNGGSVFTQQDFEKAISNQDNNHSLSGLGLKLVDELSKKINAEIQYESTATTTIATLTFKH